MNTVPINIDLNTGVIGPDVTSCTHSCKVLTGIKENSPASGADVYPNPFTTEVTFETGNNSDNVETRLTIFNIIGEQVFSHIYKQNKITLSKNDLNSGVYFYRLENNSGSSEGKLIAE
jgi:hypothetical protein